MNIKIITIFLAALMFPLNALAFGNREGAEVHSQEQSTSVRDVVYFSESVQAVSFKPAAETKQVNAQATIDKQGELFIEICVYITIIMVYWIYWLMVPNESNKTVKRD